MADSETNLKAPVPFVAIAGWILPGAGYWMIGQRTRALTVGIAVLAVYLGGLLIGGVRVIEVPGYNDRGEKIQVRVSRSTSPTMWVMAVAPTQEIKAKPWCIAQVLAGPIGIASGAVSVWAAHPVDVTTADGSTFSAPLADVSHTPVNEAGTLYTAVAGMLNLLAIIDASHRAAHREEA